MEAVAENVISVIKDFLPEAKVHQDHRKDEWDDAGYVVYSSEFKGKFLVGIEFVSQYVDCRKLSLEDEGYRFTLFRSKKAANMYLTSMTRGIDKETSLCEVEDLRDLDLSNSSCDFTVRFISLLGSAYLEDKAINRANLYNLTE